MHRKPAGRLTTEFAEAPSDSTNLPKRLLRFTPKVARRKLLAAAKPGRSRRPPEPRRAYRHPQAPSAARSRPPATGNQAQFSSVRLTAHQRRAQTKTPAAEATGVSVSWLRGRATISNCCYRRSLSVALNKRCHSQRWNWAEPGQPDPVTAIVASPSRRRCVTATSARGLRPRRVRG
jgi:hypothetical protein